MFPYIYKKSKTKQNHNSKTLMSNTTPHRIREQSDRSGFSSFLVTFFFSFHKEKKKVKEKFEIKEEF